MTQIASQQVFAGQFFFQNLRRPVEIYEGDSDQPLQLPVRPAVEFPVSAGKQAFLAMAECPVADPNEHLDSNNSYDSDPEILLSDSDEEEDELLDEDENEADARTAMDTEEEFSDSDSIGSDVFDESSSCEGAKPFDFINSGASRSQFQSDSQE